MAILSECMIHARFRIRGIVIAIAMLLTPITSWSQLAPGIMDVQWSQGSPDCAKNPQAPLQVHRYNSDTFILRENLCSTFEAPFLYLLVGSSKAPFDRLQGPIEHFIDAFLYRGPQEFRLMEPMPADIALDADYMTELRRRQSLMGFPGESSNSPKDFSDATVREAQNPILEGAPPPPDTRAIAQTCLDAKKKRENPR